MNNKHINWFILRHFNATSVACDDMSLAIIKTAITKAKECANLPTTVTPHFVYFVVVDEETFCTIELIVSVCHNICDVM